MKELARLPVSVSKSVQQDRDVWAQDVKVVTEAGCDWLRPTTH